MVATISVCKAPHAQEDDLNAQQGLLQKGQLPAASSTHRSPRIPVHFPQVALLAITPGVCIRELKP